MATNYIQPGDVITVENEDVTGAALIEAGDGVLIGSLFGVALTDIAVGDYGPIKTTGVFDLPKVSAQSWTVGAKIYWAAATNNCSTTAGSDKLIGVAVAAADNPSSTGRVKLTGAAAN